MKDGPALRALITERKRAKDAREKAQGKLIPDAEIFRRKIHDALRPFPDVSQYTNLGRCGQEELFRTCRECGQMEKFPYRCNLKWCPLCNWRITAKRSDLLKRWQARVSHPIHVVTTQRNFPVLTGSRLSANMKACAALRRQKVFALVQGGCCSTEITNEGNGWHLHNHWLLDARFVPMDKLSVAWRGNWSARYLQS